MGNLKGPPPTEKLLLRVKELKKHIISSSVVSFLRLSWFCENVQQELWRRSPCVRLRSSHDADIPLGASALTDPILETCAKAGRYIFRKGISASVNLALRLVSESPCPLLGRRRNSWIADFGADRSEPLPMFLPPYVHSVSKLLVNSTKT